MKWLKFILSHSIFISFCAVALCYQTFELLHYAVNYFIYGLIFFSTLCSYNFYWLISKYYFRGNTGIVEFLVKHFSNVCLFSIAGIGMFYCLYFIPAIIPEMFIAACFTLLYSLPLWPIKRFSFFRKAGFLKTVLLAFTWTYITVMIPAGRVAFGGGVSIALLFAARFLFMLMLCIIFDSRDINIDKIHALRSLATDVSSRTLQNIMAVVFILYLATGFLLRYYFNDTAQVVAFLITGIFTLFVYWLSLKKQDYYFYYFLVDGLMLFSALATFVASI
jgi:hypothetical protein